MGDRSDVIVVGGGLAGLAAAAYCARRGRSVTLLEKASHVGGRAVTREVNGYFQNLGPHAVYRAGEGARVLEDLGVRYSGGVPKTSGVLAVRGDRTHTFPTGPLSLLTTGLLPLGAKLEAARFLERLPRLDTSDLQGVTVAAWLGRNIRAPEVRDLLATLVHISTYANADDSASAGAALENFKLAAKANVLYLDGGWQTLVDGLRSVATSHGVRIAEGERVSAVEHHEGGVRAVRLANGERFKAAPIIVAASPHVASALVDHGEHRALGEWARALVPVKAACLDLALSRVPRPATKAAFGIGTPLYLSVHSSVARLAPEGGALVHAAKYLPPGEDSDPVAVEEELEALLDRVQPGWRECVVDRRFLPSMTVTNALVTASMGGLSGRPGPEVPGIRGLFVAGDWVGSEGMLADAALASARRAATLALDGFADGASANEVRAA